MARENETVTIRGALLERKERVEALLRNLIWAEIPAGILGKTVTKEEEATILGYGPEGY